MSILKAQTFIIPTLYRERKGGDLGSTGISTKHYGPKLQPEEVLVEEPKRALFFGDFLQIM